MIYTTSAFWWRLSISTPIVPPDHHHRNLYYKMSIPSDVPCNGPCCIGDIGMASEKTPHCKRSISIANAPQDVAQNLQVNQCWENELRGRIQIFSATVEEYLDTVVPCSTAYTAVNIPSTVFSSFKPAKGKETRSYGPLVRGRPS